MATSYLLGFNPFWYFADAYGKPLAGGTMYTWQNQNKTVPKAVYQDMNGVNAWTNPILFDATGQQGPFYFANDVPYFIQVFDANGNLVRSIDGYTPPAGSGGEDITEGLNLTNLIVNNVFYRNIGASASPIGTENLLLCPGAHSSFGATTAVNNQADIRFIKSNLASTDTLTFTAFTEGSNVLTGDVTPPVYLNYTCTSAGSGGETFKYVQYPISADIQSTSNQPCTVTIWARCNSGVNTLELNFYQFFGDGAGASTPVTFNASTLNLSSSWEKYEITTTIPNITAQNLGACQNTGIYLQVQYPLSQATNIDHVKPSVYLSNIAPDLDYLTNDQIDAVINAPRTGDVRISVNAFTPFGWAICNDGTIGNPSSNASRANFDTFPLFDLIYNSVSNTYAPLLNSSGVPIARSGSSITDFSANNQLSLTKQLGRLIASAGTPSSGNNTGNNWPLGLYTGNEITTLQLNNIPQHVHDVTIAGAVQSYCAGGGSSTYNTTGGLNTTYASGFNNGSTNPTTAFNIQNPVIYYNVFLKL